MTILLIENGPDLLRMLSLLLKKSGFEVFQATTGEQACELYRANAEIRVIVASAYLPGMDGPSTIARLREINPQLRFCFITSGNPQELHGCGAPVFQKPFSIDEFMRTVRRLAAP